MMARAMACLLLAFGSTATAESGSPWSIEGGRLALNFNANTLNLIKLDPGAAKAEGEFLSLIVTVEPQGTLEFQAPGGRFEKMLGGSLPLTGLSLSWPGGDLSKMALRLAPVASEPPALQAIDGEGATWLLFEYGHFDVEGETLAVRVMDVVAGPALAAALGNPRLTRFHLGNAELKAQVNRPESWGIKGACSGPNWPTDGFTVDLEMLAMASVDQTFNDGERVAITPSALFGNTGPAGTADVPWYAMFATPASDPFCFDAGDGTCEPYGVDQGGLLVWHLYRFLDGRLEQLGRSGVKHAFNSTNGNCPCGSGRIVWRQCTDLYATSTNASQDFLGPREEITANQVSWDHTGSIWDQNSDGVCDDIVVANFFGGVRCGTSPATALERRLHVAEADLAVPGARYFLESWYLARDEVDIFNNLGHRELDPQETQPDVWTFLDPGLPFVQGPVMDELPGLADADAGQVVDTLDTGEGHLRAITSVSQIDVNQWRYDIALMNFDFDRAINRIGLPLAANVTASGLAFFDGDANPGNDWTAATSSGQVSFQAPAGASLTWGQMVSFRFIADQEPVPAMAELTVDQAGDPALILINSMSGSDGLFADGFE